MKNLVIVESPTKARTLSKYLGSDFQIEASMGHIRDLPKGELGIDTEHDFKPKYVIPRDKTKRVNDLKKLAKVAKTLYLATDPDREGEAIAWHLSELMGSENSHRVEFHEITEEAILEAFKKPREIDLKLVDAQQARRILDRLVGYKLSPLLWKKVKSGLSAGRVQSVTLRLIVEKEEEIKAFKAVEYWSVGAELDMAGPVTRQPHSTSSLDDSLRALSGAPRLAPPASSFVANLIEQNGKKLEIKNKEEADLHVKNLEKAKYEVEKVTKKEARKYPVPPFTTSTLQQTASNRLGYSSKKTMSLAQVLYEHGIISYMRTDSVNLSPVFISSCRNYIEQNIGKAYLAPSVRIYKTKSKSAQEAHEAIRPTNISLTVEKLKTMAGVTRDHVRLYDLIWKRAVACQMSDAVLDQTSIDVIARSEATKQSNSEIATLPSVARNDNEYLLRATGSVIKFPGWLKIYGKGNEEEEEEGDKILPELTEKEMLELIKLLPEQHFTEPPARFNEASLIKKLEELGIGRPSTYAPTISTIIDRFYVEKKEKKFFPTELGITVIKFLMKYFAEILDYDFTAEMENSLDEIAEGNLKWQPLIAKFYKPFEEKLEKVEQTAEKVKIETEVVDKLCPKCGKNLQIKFGKFGKFLACSGFPACKHTESLEEKVDAKCPDCGGDIILRKTRKGRPFYGCKNWPNCKFASWTKPKTKELEVPKVPEEPNGKEMDKTGN
ncbi:MAG: type I DNA topoisomerase [Candidatus Daviesbacteria bacterium]|nr:type I DNA topoisomerase [Candidatus Daviesbacteria bacterium]